ncbi:MAG TPA: hypothetical protein PL001_01400, partial [Candidatus Kryptobacter bacterium]|nr:hypothetical protein [Candidatus Kryptobacter bacterium]
MSKTVYLLGAGFSRCAGAPSQKYILHEIFKAEHRPGDYQSQKFVWAREVLRAFINTVFEPISQDEVDNLSLEDIFTFLDKAALDNSGFQSFSKEQVAEARVALNFCVVFLFDRLLQGDSPSFYRKLATALVENRIDAGQSKDPFAIVSLNWDIILDRALH